MSEPVVHSVVDQTEAQMATCDRCGQVYSIGDWPYCPHGEARTFGNNPFHEYVDENLVPDHLSGKTVGLSTGGHVVEGVRVTSRDQRRRLMKAGKLEFRSPRRGLPGCEV